MVLLNLIIMAMNKIMETWKKKLRERSWNLIWKEIETKKIKLSTNNFFPMVIWSSGVLESCGKSYCQALSIYYVKSQDSHLSRNLGDQRETYHRVCWDKSESNVRKCCKTLKDLEFSHRNAFELELYIWWPLTYSWKIQHQAWFRT